MEMRLKHYWDPILGSTYRLERVKPNLNLTLTLKVNDKATKAFQSLNQSITNLKLAENHYRKTRLRILHELNFEMLPYYVKKAKPELKELTSHNWKYVKDFPKLLEELKDMMSQRIRPRRLGMTQAMLQSIINQLSQGRTIFIVTQDIQGTMEQIKHIPNVHIETSGTGILMMNNHFTT